MRARLSSTDTSTGGAAPAPGIPAYVEDDGAAPIRAGMRARAIADACERLALPAVMIDKAARVLHVGASMAQMRDSGFTIAAGHLVGRTDEANRSVERAVMIAIGGKAEPDDATAEVGDGVLVRGLPFNDPSPYQIMRGIVVLVPGGTNAAARLSTLQAMLG